jgi:sugar lactone lactonase YvrE
MTMRSRFRLPAAAKLAAVALTSAALTVTLAGPVAAHPRSADGNAALPSRIALPNGFLPEGITVGRGGVAYLGSRADGDIYAVDLNNGKGGVISQGPGAGNPSVGLKYGRDRLYVAGGNGKNGRVVDARTGAILASYTFTAKDSFINDVVLGRKKAWFTNSLQPELYSVTRSRDAAKAKVATLKLRGDWVQAPGVNNANGIVKSPDARSLLVVQSNTGNLFKVNPRTGVARKVNLGGALLTNGDGLLLRGRTLYAVQNRLNQVAVVHLNQSGSRGRLVDTLTSADLPAGTSFDVPTTVAAYKGNLYLPNARFTNPAPATADYWITRLPLHR